MADLLSRTYSFTDGTTAYGSQVEAEIANIVDVLNNCQAGTQTWERVYVQHATAVPLISDCLAGSQNIAEFKNNSSTKASIASTGAITLVPTSNQLVLGTTRTVTITAPTPASASRTVTIPDLSGDYSVVGTTGTQAITGAKTFDSSALKLQEAGSTDVVTVAVASLAASRTYTVPDAGADASFVISAGTSTISGTKTFDGQLIGKGTATNDNAASGYIGEVLSATTVRGSHVALSNGTSANVTSLSLTAGHWDVYCSIGFDGTGVSTELQGALATTSATLPGTNVRAVPTSNEVTFNWVQSVATADSSQAFWCPVRIASTTTVYLVANAAFPSGTVNAYGSIFAVRRR